MRWLVSAISVDNLCLTLHNLILNNPQDTRIALTEIIENEQCFYRVRCAAAFCLQQVHVKYFYFTVALSAYQGTWFGGLRDKIVFGHVKYNIRSIIIGKKIN